MSLASYLYVRLCVKKFALVYLVLENTYKKNENTWENSLKEERFI